MQTTTSPPAFTAERVQQAANAILEVLGEPETTLHREALSAFQREDYMTVKRLAATNLSDSYCKSLAYLGSAFKLTPNTDTILAESARSAADFAKEHALTRLSEALAKALA